MNKGEKKLICILLFLIAISCLFLIIKISNAHQYDQAIYEDIYDEYNQMVSNIESQSDNKNNNEILNQNITEKSNIRQVYKNATSEDEYKVIGQVNIPKLNINYPIIYKTTEEYLKISPTKLCGPNVNREGNLCIIGHNYKNFQFFSKLSKLENGDNITLMNQSGTKMNYKVYNKYEVDASDLSCTSQQTNGNIEATLITCTADKNKRLVVKCRTESLN